MSEQEKTKDQLLEELQQINARLQRDLAAAAKIQKSLLPSTLPKFNDLRFAWCFRPCEELAGDNLNVIPFDDDHLGVYVLDVSGHGITASLLAVTLHRVLSSPAEHGSITRRPRQGGGWDLIPPAQVAEQLNREFSMHLEYRQYFTILYGILHRPTLEFRFVSGGHWGPIHLPREEKAKLIHAPGFPVGVFEDTKYEEHVVQLAPGDRMFLYSDGIPEARNQSGDQFDYQRIEQSLEGSRGCSLSECLSELIKQVDHFQNGEPQDDDISLLAFELGAD